MQNKSAAPRVENIENYEGKVDQTMSSFPDDQQILSPQRENCIPPTFQRSLLQNRNLIKSQNKAKRFSPIQRKWNQQETNNSNFPQKVYAMNTQSAAKQQDFAYQQRKSQPQKIKANIEDSDFFKFIEIKQISPGKIGGKSRKENQFIQQQVMNKSNIFSATTSKKNQDIKGISLTQNVIPSEDFEYPLSTIHSKQQSAQKIAVEIDLNLGKTQPEETNYQNQIKQNYMEQSLSRGSTSTQATQKIFNLNFDMSSTNYQEQMQPSKRKFSNKQSSIYNESPEITGQRENGEGYYTDIISPYYGSVSLESEKQITLGSTRQIADLLPISNTLVKDQILGTNTQGECTSFYQQEERKTEADTFDGISYYKERFSRDANNKNKKIVLSRLKIRNKTTERYSNHISEETIEDREYTDTNRRSKNYKQVIQIQMQNNEQSLYSLQKRRMELNKRGMSVQDPQYNPYLTNNPFNQLKSYVQNACDKISEKRQLSLNTDYTMINNRVVAVTQQTPNKQFIQDSDCYNFSVGNSITIHQNTANTAKSPSGKQSPKVHLYSPSRKRVFSIGENFQKNMSLKGEDFLHISSIQQHTLSTKNEQTKQNIFNSTMKPKVTLDQNFIPNYYDYNIAVNYESIPTTINFYDSFQTPQSHTHKTKIKYYNDNINNNNSNLSFSASPAKLNPPPSYMILKDFVQQRQKPEKLYNSMVNQKQDLTKKGASEKYSPQKILQVNLNN